MRTIFTTMVAVLIMVACSPSRVSVRPLARDPSTPCPPGQDCKIKILSFPFVDKRDTRNTGSTRFNRYGCAPEKDLSGAEVIYALTVTHRSLLFIEVDDEPGDSVDIDLHLLTELREGACRARHNRSLYELLEPGEYFVVADTFVGPDSRPRAGPYELRAQLQTMPENACAMRQAMFKMRWRECASEIDCHEKEAGKGKIERFLRMPAVGPVVKEAHLVTVEDDFGSRDWPKNGTHGIGEHHDRAQKELPFRAELRQPWAPAGEGGSRWGQGSSGDPIPVRDEMWYITMNWAQRPPAGTRMIVRNPDNGRAVVAAAGYETGPGSPTAIAGVSEEIHHYLGTTHRDHLLVGFAMDPSLPFGPVGCQ